MQVVDLILKIVLIWFVVAMVCIWLISGLFQTGKKEREIYNKEKYDA